MRGATQVGRRVTGAGDCGQRVEANAHRGASRVIGLLSARWAGLRTWATASALGSTTRRSRGQLQTTSPSGSRRGPPRPWGGARSRTWRRGKALRRHRVTASQLDALRGGHGPLSRSALCRGHGVTGPGKGRGAQMLGRRAPRKRFENADGGAAAGLRQWRHVEATRLRCASLAASRRQQCSANQMCAGSKPPSGTGAPKTASIRTTKANVYGVPRVRACRCIISACSAPPRLAGLGARDEERDARRGRAGGGTGAGAW